MAKIYNQKYATFDWDVWAHRERVLVGNNRHLQIIKGDNSTGLIYTLHGNQIVTYLLDHVNGTRTVIFNTCGYMTVTTRAAMCDAMNLFGFNGGVSFAKGKMSIRLNGEDKTEEQEQTERMLLGQSVDNRVMHFVLPPDISAGVPPGISFQQVSEAA